MGEEEKSLLSHVAVCIWLSSVTGLGLTKIIVGSIYVDGGCLGLCLLPYYFLIGGILALIPAALCVLTSCSRSTSTLVEMWGTMAKLFAFAFTLMVAATIYILVSAVRVRSLDRLCTDSWVPIFGLCIVTADWISFGIFFRLFCVHSLPDPRPTGFEQEFFAHDESPFYAWKQRQARRF